MSDCKCKYCNTELEEVTVNVIGDDGDFCLWCPKCDWYECDESPPEPEYERS